MEPENRSLQHLRPATQPDPAAIVVTVRYWAAARAAAGRDTEQLSGCQTVRDVVAQVNQLHPDLRAVTAVSTLLMDGRPASPAQPLTAGAVLEVLPPFAGG